MKQEIKNVRVEDLVLWTENPRDPMDPDAKDQDIINRALEDRQSKWSLIKLAKGMGDYYDFSELPTVVYHGKKPIVYDGNRRIVLAKLKLGLAILPEGIELILPDVPMEIPCNVCERKVALNNVYRKHGDSGSWSPLERDIFLHKFMGKEKSAFLILEEDTGFISANPHMNQRFVKEEILTDEMLKNLGFSTKSGRLKTSHDSEAAFRVLNDISNKVKYKKISTRENRGKVLEILDPENQHLISTNSENRIHLARVNFESKSENTDGEITKPRKLTRRVSQSKREIFGGKLYLTSGETSNLYRDIVDLYDFYVLNKNRLSNTFQSLVRMSLRMLCETASKDKGKQLADYLKDNFEEAKTNLSKDLKTTLANHNVSSGSIVQLLHTGAHNYSSSNNTEQMLAMSIIIGGILTITHGKVS